MKQVIGVVVLLAMVIGARGALIIDHNDIDITQLKEEDILRAKQVLHIGYGHTSHGSQITDGMDGLVGFANGGGLGMTFTNDIFEFNNGGLDGALDLEEGDGYGSGWLDHDCGYWPNWYNETVTYLEDPSHADVNVIMWSWCGQMDNEYASGVLSNQYLLPMTSLETSYPDVVFVYMTGHAPDAGSMSASLDNNTKEACQAIRDYCTANNKVFFDFNDIEHYDPDGTYFEFVTDNCAYYATNSGSSIGNWATEWQDSHTQNVDWYSCGSAHSQPLNANMKAFAIWKLWCELGKDLDRDDIPDVWEEQHGGVDDFQGGTNDYDGDGMSDLDEYIADTNPTNDTSNFVIDDLVLTNNCSISFGASTSRVYSLLYCDNLVSGEWAYVSGQTNQYGVFGQNLTLTDTNAGAHCAYRVEVQVP